jgi:hypothetical protein
MPRGKPAEHSQSRSLDSGGSFFRANDVWMASQAMLFEHFDEVARRWLDRRREALDATRRSIAEMRDTNDMGEVFRIHQEWVLGSMQRLASDLGELSQAAMSLTQRAATQVGSMTQEGVQIVDKSSSDLLSAAGSKPQSTP